MNGAADVGCSSELKMDWHSSVLLTSLFFLLSSVYAHYMCQSNAACISLINVVDEKIASSKTDMPASIQLLIIGLLPTKDRGASSRPRLRCTSSQVGGLHQLISLIQVSDWRMGVALRSE